MRFLRVGLKAKGGEANRLPPTTYLNIGTRSLPLSKRSHGIALLRKVSRKPRTMQIRWRSATRIAPMAKVFTVWTCRRVRKGNFPFTLRRTNYGTGLLPKRTHGVTALPPCQFPTRAAHGPFVSIRKYRLSRCSKRLQVARTAYSLHWRPAPAKHPLHSRSRGSFLVHVGI